VAAVSVRDLAPGDRLTVQRDDVVVVVPLFGGHEHAVRCLTSLLRHTPDSVPILVADDASPDPATRAWAERLPGDREVTWLRQPENLGFVGNCNVAFAVTAPADVVLVNSDVVVAAGWLEGLRDAARSDSGIATATALTNHGSLLSVPYRNRPVQAFPQTSDFDELAAEVLRRSERLRPRLLTAVGHCVWIRRAALELVGPFDDAFAPAYGEEVDFSQRCLAAGLQHVAADDVLVLHHGHASLGVEGERSPLQAAHEETLAARHRYYAGAVEMTTEQRFSPLARTIGNAARAVRGLTVTIDARCLDQTVTGTQIQVLEVIAALARTGEARLRVAAPTGIGPMARAVLADLPGVEVVAAPDLFAGDPVRTDIVHRPFQVSELGDLKFLEALGERIVLTNQDLIAFRNPAYFRSGGAWQSYRRFTAEAMALASVVVFISEHGRADALAEDLVPEHRTRVAPNGVDHAVVRLDPTPARPRGLPDPGGAPFLLCLGTTFHHKNRMFALRLLEALRRRHGWAGRLVFAGPDITYGSSIGDETAWLALHPELRESVTVLPAVSEPEKAWLLGECAAVVYPTTYEGFGLVPFEAADAGRPCLFAPMTSLAEILPADAALLVPWDQDASADNVIGVLEDPATAQAQVERVRAAAARYTWDTTAARLLGAYEHALSLPVSEMLRLEEPELTGDARYWHFRHAIGATGLSLVEPDQQLLPDDVQRTLAALSRRQGTRKALFAGLRGMRRVVGRKDGEPDAAEPDATGTPVDDEPERLFPENPPGY